MPAPPLTDLPLFPLHTVLFPEGLLALKVFEARYVDLVSACLRTGAPFGVVRLVEGRDVHTPGGEPVRFETVGVLAHVREVDADRPGILAVRCQGAQRFMLSAPRQRSNGLWLAEATLVGADESLPVPVAAKQRLMALDDPLLRLRLVDEYLHSHGVA